MILLVMIFLFGIIIILLFVVCRVVEKICMFNIVFVMLLRLIYLLVWNGWNIISSMFVVRFDSDFCSVKFIVKLVVFSIVIIEVVCMFICFRVVISVKVIIVQCISVERKLVMVVLILCVSIRWLMVLEMMCVMIILMIRIVIVVMMLMVQFSSSF